MIQTQRKTNLYECAMTDVNREIDLQHMPYNACIAQIHIISFYFAFYAVDEPFN